MSSNDRKRKRPKSYYMGGAKQARGGGKQSQWQTLTVGLKGFLMTCNSREKDCVREAYNLLNQYADEMYGPEEGFLKDKTKGDTASGEEEDDDIEAALKKEVQEMKDVKAKDRRFQVVDTGAKNCIFVKTTVEDPVKLVRKIMSDVVESKECKVRKIQRLMPITHTCKAYEDDIKTLMPTILQPHLDKYTNVTPSYCVMFKVRNNNNIGRSEIHEIVGEIMMDSRVDTVDPDLVVICEVIKTICCVSVVTDYFKFRKFNMHEIVQRTIDFMAGTVTKNETKDDEKTVESESKGGDTVTNEDGGEGTNDEKGDKKNGEQGENDAESSVASAAEVPKGAAESKEVSTVVSVPEVDNGAAESGEGSSVVSAPEVSREAGEDKE